MALHACASIAFSSVTWQICVTSITALGEADYGNEGSCYRTRVLRLEWLHRPKRSHPAMPRKSAAIQFSEGADVTYFHKTPNPS